MQPELLQPEQLSPRLRWEKLFGFLPAWPEPGPIRGRKPIARQCLVKALIYQRLRRLRFLTDLHAQLLEQPFILAALGLDPYQRPPSLERFSAFLADEPHQPLEQMRIELVDGLRRLGLIRGQHLGLDSCPVASWVRENNLKSALRRRRYDKETPPQADPDARLGVRIHYPNPGQTQLDYFWGYRNHTLADLESELPVWEITEPNSVSEVSVAMTLLQTAQQHFQLPILSVSADAEYDTDKILNHVVHTLGAKPFIPYNPRNAQDQRGFRRDGLAVYCPAQLPMHRHGRMTVKGISYVQYRCPFYEGPRPALLLCPVSHPKFTGQKGCNYLWRTSANLRDQIPYGSQEFKQHYNRRSGIERIFSRLLALTIQEPSVHGLNSVRNHCTISHLAVLLVALAAHQLGQQDKIRFVRTFVPNFLS